MQSALAHINSIDEAWSLAHPRASKMVREPFEIERGLAAIDGLECRRIEIKKISNDRYIKLSCTDGYKYDGEPMPFKKAGLDPRKNRPKPQGFGAA